MISARLAVLFAVAVGTGTAMAQQSDPQAAYAQVGKYCITEARRLCPGLDPNTPQPHNMVICLRPYKSSLSLACRHAVLATSS